MTGLEAAREAATLRSESETAAEIAAARAEGAAEARGDQAEAELVARSEGADGARTRIKAILTHPAAVGREALAQRLAFETTVSAADAVALMEAAPAAAPAQRQSRINAPAPRIDAVEAGASTDPFAPRAYGQASPTMKRLLASKGQTPLSLVEDEYYLPEYAIRQ